LIGAGSPSAVRAPRRNHRACRSRGIGQIDILVDFQHVFREFFGFVDLFGFDFFPFGRLLGDRLLVLVVLFGILRLDAGLDLVIDQNAGRGGDAEQAGIEIELVGLSGSSISTCFCMRAPPTSSDDRARSSHRRSPATRRPGSCRRPVDRQRSAGGYSRARCAASSTIRSGSGS